MKQRLHWIDFLRGIAVLGMIEAHSVNSFLAPVFRSGSWFMLLSYLNGWVAPTFLFLAGFLQGAWVRKNWDLSKPIAPKLRHLGIILLIGYALQFPWFHPFDRTLVLTALGRVDVLHCIAVSLVAVLLLTKICRTLLTFERVILLLTVAIVASAPFVWETVVSANPLAGYLTPKHGALFPLIPWSAFVFSGVLSSRWLDRKPAELARAFLILFVATAAAGWLLRGALSDWFQIQTYATRYDFFFFRLSLVLLGCLFCLLTVPATKTHALNRGVLWCGNQSLWLYVWHLIILHSGLGFLPPLRSLFPKTQFPFSVLCLFLLTLGLTLLVTWLVKKLTSALIGRSQRPAG